MSTQSKAPSQLRVFGSLQILVLSALFVAISITGKVCAFNIGGVIRISFENLPIFMAGFCFGPLIGALVGIVSDLVGCLFAGYAPNAIITVGAALIGALSGVVYHHILKSESLSIWLRVGAGVVVARVISSSFVKTYALHVMMKTPYWALLWSRQPAIWMEGILEVLLIVTLLQNGMIKRHLKRIGQA